MKDIIIGKEEEEIKITTIEYNCYFIVVKLKLIYIIIHIY